jgi:hypothetical protein
MRVATDSQSSALGFRAECAPELPDVSQAFPSGLLLVVVAADLGAVFAIRRTAHVDERIHRELSFQIGFGETG